MHCRYLINSFDDDAVIVERGISLMNAATKTVLQKRSIGKRNNILERPKIFPLFQYHSMKKQRIGDPHAAHEVD